MYIVYISIFSVDLVAVEKLELSRNFSHLNAIIFGDENISFNASFTCFIPTIPFVPFLGLPVTFCDSAISTARLQISRQRLASPDTAATYKEEINLSFR